MRVRESDLRGPRGACLVAFCLALAATPATALEYEPFDWVPLPAGTNVVMLYSVYAHSNEFDNEVTGTTQARLDSYIEVARYLHYGTIFNHTFVLDVIAPFGVLANGQIGQTHLGSGSGAGDPILSVGYWLINDPSKKRYLSAVAFVTLPVGSYDHDKALNLGVNRWQNDTQVDLTQGLGSRYTLDLSADWTVYGDNTDAGPMRQTLRQKDSYGAYAWLTRDVTSEVRQLSPHAGKAYLSVGWYGSWGGAQTLNGVSTGGRTEEQQVRVTYQQFITPTLEGNISLNHDVSANGQFKQGFGLLLRLAKIF